MPIGVQIGAPAEAGWDDPIGMLTDCHRRVEHFLAILVSLAEANPQTLFTADESRALDASLHYFHTSGQTHNADEEDSLVPRLACAPAAAETLPLAAQLAAEHRQAAELHSTIERLLNARRSRTLLAQESNELQAAARVLDALYRAHIQMEETRVFPAARRHLAPADITAIGAELRARRGR